MKRIVMVSQYSSDRGGIRGEKVLKIVKFEETPFGVFKYNRYFIRKEDKLKTTAMTDFHTSMNTQMDLN